MKQLSIKQASFSFAYENATDDVRSHLDRLIVLRPAKPNLVDIKVWEHLDIGDIPGVPGWHYDIWNDPVKGASDVHALFIVGAGCQTEFRFTRKLGETPVEYTTLFVPESSWYFYTGAEEHRISPATKAGSRLLIRASWLRQPPIPKNDVYTPLILKGATHV